MKKRMLWVAGMAVYDMPERLRKQPVRRFGHCG